MITPVKVDDEKSHDMNTCSIIMYKKLILFYAYYRTKLRMASNDTNMSHFLQNFCFHAIFFAQVWSLGT